MNHGTVENIRVKNQIVDGLFKLLAKTSFSNITVSELIKTSQVARASYYRNFNDKEEILEYYFDTLKQKRHISSDDFNGQNIVKLHNELESAFSLFLNERQKITLLLKNNLSGELYNIILNQVLTVAGDMPMDSPERYKLYFYAGSIYSVLSEWLLSGTKESPSQMADLILSYLENGIFH